jgi:hypothetical protein
MPIAVSDKLSLDILLKAIFNLLGLIISNKHIPKFLDVTSSPESIGPMMQPIVRSVDAHLVLTFLLHEVEHCAKGNDDNHDKNHDQMLHHEHEGIREAVNRLFF